MNCVKFTLIVILLLLIGSNNLLAESKLNNTSTGEIILSDTSVIVPINFIKEANAKLTERLYLIDLNNHKDSIIVKNNKEIKDLKIELTDAKNNNKYLNKINKFFIIVGSVLLIGLICK